MVFPVLRFLNVVLVFIMKSWLYEKENHAEVAVRGKKKIKWFHNVGGKKEKMLKTRGFFRRP